MGLGPLQEAWVKTLESGEYQQGNGRLVTLENDQEFCCCLGVLCLMNDLEKEVHQPAPGMPVRYMFGGEGFYLPMLLVEKYHFFNHRGEAKGAPEEEDRTDSLAYMNDQGKSFAEIAAIVREHPNWFFSEEV